MEKFSRSLSHQMMKRKKSKMFVYVNKRKIRRENIA